MADDGRSESERKDQPAVKRKRNGSLRDDNNMGDAADASSAQTSAAMDCSDGNATLDKDGWVRQFLAMPAPEQPAALDALVDSLSTHENPTLLGHLAQRTRERLKRDVLGDLPEELGLHIMSFLDAVSLCRCRRVSRRWRELASNDWLWAVHCRGYIDNHLRPHLEERRGQRIPSYFHLYQQYSRLSRRWASGDATVATVPAHSTHFITCMKLASDGRVITGSDDFTLNIWNLATRQCESRLVGHTGGVWCCAVADDRVVSGSTDRTLRIWELSSSRCLHVLHGHESTVRSVVVANDTIYSGSRDHTIRVWSLSEGTAIRVLVGHTDSVRCLTVQDRLLVSGSYDCSVRVWNTIDPNYSSMVLRGHTNRIYCIASNGRYVAAGSLDLTICVWNIPSGDLLHVLRGHQQLTSHIAFSEENVLVSANGDSTLRMWDLETGECLHILAGHTRTVSSLIIHDQFIFSGSDDGTVRMWRRRDGRFIRSLVGPGVLPDHVVWRLVATPTCLVCAGGPQPHDVERPGSVLVFCDFGSE